MWQKVLVITTIGVMGLALAGCSKEKQASKDVIIDQTQGQLNQMKDDIKAAEKIKNKAFEDTEKALGKRSASE